MTSHLKTRSEDMIEDKIEVAFSELSNEIVSNIISFCTFSTSIEFMKTSKKNYSLVKYFFNDLDLSKTLFVKYFIDKHTIEYNSYFIKTSLLNQSLKFLHNAFSNAHFQLKVGNHMRYCKSCRVKFETCDIKAYFLISNDIRSHAITMPSLYQELWTDYITPDILNDKTISNIISIYYEKISDDKIDDHTKNVYLHLIGILSYYDNICQFGNYKIRLVVD